MSLGVVQVLVDENTDPTSLLLSNCSVDGAHLGKFPLFLSTFHLLLYICLSNTPSFNLILFNKNRSGMKSFMFSLGLDEITSEKEESALSRQRKAATKATEELRKKPTDEDEDEDYEPKLNPGCHPVIPP